MKKSSYHLCTDDREKHRYLCDRERDRLDKRNLLSEIHGLDEIERGPTTIKMTSTVRQIDKRKRKKEKDETR